VAPITIIYILIFYILVYMKVNHAEQPLSSVHMHTQTQKTHKHTQMLEYPGIDFVNQQWWVESTFYSLQSFPTLPAFS